MFPKKIKEIDPNKIIVAKHNVTSSHVAKACKEVGKEVEPYKVRRVGNRWVEGRGSDSRFLARSNSNGQIIVRDKQGNERRFIPIN